jgi:hypothetical protein
MRDDVPPPSPNLQPRDRVERATEDTDILWIRSPDAEATLLAALREVDALFDYVPGFPDEPVATVWKTAVELDGVRFASLEWLRRMKQAAGRPKDLLDLENLPAPN